MNNKINFTQDYIIYKPKIQGVYPIQETDWNRLKGLVRKIIPEKNIYRILSSISFGIFISSIFSILSLYSISNLPSWLLPTNWAILIASLILGIALIIIDNQQTEIIKLSSDFIIKEMEIIEGNYNKEKGQQRLT